VELHCELLAVHLDKSHGDAKGLEEVLICASRHPKRLRSETVRTKCICCCPRSLTCIPINRLKPISKVVAGLESVVNKLRDGVAMHSILAWLHLFAVITCITIIADIRSMPVILANCLVPLAINGSSRHPLAALLTTAKVERPEPRLGLLRELATIRNAVLVQMAAETDLRLVPCEPLLALRALYEAVGICAGVGVLHVTVSWSCSIIKAVVRFFCRLGSAVGCWHVDIGLGLRSCAGLLYYWIRSKLQAVVCDGCDGQVLRAHPADTKIIDEVLPIVEAHVQ
jgi:hypothetical protein